MPARWNCCAALRDGHLTSGLHVPENRYAQGLVKLGADIKPEYFQEEDIYNLVSLCVWLHCGRPGVGTGRRPGEGDDQ